MALETINKCLADAISALTRGRLDGDSQTAGLIHSGNEILETYKYLPDARLYPNLTSLYCISRSYMLFFVNIFKA